MKEKNEEDEQMKRNLHQSAVNKKAKTMREQKQELEKKIDVFRGYIEFTVSDVTQRCAFLQLFQRQSTGTLSHEVKVS